MNGIVWLASYPRSGNTWMRAFLTNLSWDGERPASINELKGRGAASRLLFDEVAGVESSDLTQTEIERLQPLVFARLASRSEGTLFLKTHLAFSGASGPRIPTAGTLGALYLVRNPLDVAVSYAHHTGKPIDVIIDRMADEEHALAGRRDRVRAMLPEPLTSWSSHVLGWMEGPSFCTHVVRFEDMVRAPLATFRRAALFVGETDDPERIEQAVRFSSFDELRSQEREHGFLDRSPHAPSFFRKGKVGSWREVLTEPQARRLVDRHRVAMEELAYLSPSGAPLF